MTLSFFRLYRGYKLLLEDKKIEIILDMANFLITYLKHISRAFLQGD